VCGFVAPVEKWEKVGPLCRALGPGLWGFLSSSTISDLEPGYRHGVLGLSLRLHPPPSSPL
jgi:hypothetical protein